MGQAQYKWIITDTLGNMLSQKQNYLPSFVSQTGSFGGINKFEDKISWWDMYNDSVFTIAPDFSYRLSGLFPPGNYRRSHDGIKFSSPQEYIDEESKICTTLKFFESNNYWIYMYRYNLYGIAFIDKRKRETKSGLTELNSCGIKNDLDGGPIFLPKGYYNQNGVEYLVGVVNSYQLITQIGSKEFRNSKPKHPDKKKDLAKFTLGLNENDNPIIMLVKLKK